MKEALCLMYDNTQPVNIFGKIYQPGDFPKKLYYKYKDPKNEEYIDMTSINFYEDQGLMILRLIIIRVIGYLCWWQ